MERKITESFEKLRKALDSLGTIIVKPMQDDRSNIDASIQRFEFCVELFWKLLKRIIEAQGQEVHYPKEVLREAYAGKLINDEQIWIAMLQDRNLTSHTYNEQLADSIYSHIKETYYPLMRKTFENLYQSYT